MTARSATYVYMRPLFLRIQITIFKKIAPRIKPRRLWIELWIHVYIVQKERRINAVGDDLPDVADRDGPAAGFFLNITPGIARRTISLKATPMTGNLTSHSWSGSAPRMSYAD